MEYYSTIKQNKLLTQQHGYISQIERNKTQKSMLYRIHFMKLKKRQNWSMVIEVLRGVTCEMGVLPGKKHTGTVLGCRKHSVFIRVMCVYICKNSLNYILVISALSAHYHVYALLQFLKAKINQDPLPKYPPSGEPLVGLAKLKWMHFVVPLGESLTWQTTTNSKGNWIDPILSHNEILQVWI